MQSSTLFAPVHSLLQGSGREDLCEKVQPLILGIVKPVVKRHDILVLELRSRQAKPGISGAEGGLKLQL